MVLVVNCAKGNLLRASEQIWSKVEPLIDFDIRNVEKVFYAP